MVQCLAAGYSNTYKNAKGGVTFHKLPQDDNGKQRWLAKIKREGKLPKPGNCFVCSDHFTADDFERNLQVFYFFFSFTSHSHEILRCGISCLFHLCRFYCFYLR